MLFIAFFVSLLFSCKKDKFETISPDSPKSNFHTPNLPISISEAKSFFDKLNLTPQSSYDGDSSKILNIRVEPIWEEAFLSSSISGREIIVAPLSDNRISALNNGRAGAKLIFSRSGADTILVEVLLYIADSTYYATNNNIINFIDFTGCIAIFDLGLHFKYGINVVNGSPVGEVKSIHKGNMLSLADEREEIYCYTDSEIIAKAEWF